MSEWVGLGEDTKNTNQEEKTERGKEKNLNVDA